MFFGVDVGVGAGAGAGAGAGVGCCDIVMLRNWRTAVQNGSIAFF